MMDFKDIPDRRYQGREPLEQAHLVMLRILRVFDRICKANKLEYWLDWGTLLGAVRHKGFIPWDDDLDVAMMPRDFEIFCEIAAKELPEDMFFQTKETDPGYRMHHAKIRDRYSTMIEDENETCLRGIFIDIFPMNVRSEDMRKARKEIRLAALLYMLKYPMHSSNHWYFLFVKRSLYYIGRLIPQSFIDRKIQKMASRHSLKKESCISYDLKSFQREVLFLSDIFPLREMEFEGFFFPVPANPENVLKEQFGEDYMTPPSPSRRIPHAKRIDPFHGSGHRENLDWAAREVNQ